MREPGRFNSGDADHMDNDEILVRQVRDDFTSLWDREEKCLVTQEEVNLLLDETSPLVETTVVNQPMYIGNYGVKEEGSCVSMSPDFNKGKRIFKVVLSAPVLSTNKLYVVTWAPTGKATPTPQRGRVYKVTEGGLFLPVRPHRVKTKYHRAWKASVLRQLAASDSAVPGCIPPSTECYVRIWVHSNWMTKDERKILRRDLGNCEKALLDTLFEHVQADDSILFTIYMAKVRDYVEAFTVEVGTLHTKFGR